MDFFNLNLRNYRSDTLHNSLQRFLGWTVKVLEIIAGVMLVIMMALTLVDVIGRYVFSAPIFGASEMISMLLVVVIFAGLGICNARDEHIVVELFDDRFRQLSPKFYHAIIQMLSIITMLLIAWVLFEQALESYHYDSRTEVLNFPLVLVTTVVSLLALISMFSLITGLIVNDDNKKGAPS